MKKVAIVQKALAQYRVDFHNLLKKRLAQEDIELTLIYSKYKTADALKKDEIDLDWAYCVPGRIVKIGPFQLLWQSCLSLIKDQDLVVVEQANKNVLNYILIIKRILNLQKIAYWGHGVNRQIKQEDIRNSFKKAFQNQCDWWFAYTEKVKEYLIQNNFPEEKITSLNNAIDTKFLTESYYKITNHEVQEKKSELKIVSENIAIYCGGMYSEKRIEFLLEACQLIRKQVSDFTLIVIGAGPDAFLFENAAKTNSWIHYLGPRFGYEKITYFKLSKVFLMPGLVGLAILDSFALETPIVTTEYEFHSPEIEYLENGVNGLISKNTVNDYSNSVISLFENEKKRIQLIQGGKIAALKYTVENMVENFTLGVLKCLKIESRPILSIDHDTSVLSPLD